MDANDIEEVVRNYIPFTNPSAKGWHSVYCEVCGDGSRTKGPRGGWLFENEVCFYNCFNCGITGNFDPNRDHPHSKEMYNIFRAFGIPEKDVNAVITTKLKDNKKNIKRPKKIYLPSIKKPDYFKLLKHFSKKNELAKEARYFLWENYKIKDDDYPFYMSTGKTQSSDKENQYYAKYLRSRIIIPSFNNDRMLFWQARTIFNDEKKYISASVENSEAVIYGFDNLFDKEKPLDIPLYITEGFFDSWHVNGIAVITNTMKPAKIALIKRSKRPKVVIPDYNKDGMNLANQAIQLNWGIALPDILPCTDICQAINYYGKLYVIKSIVKNTYHGFEAKMRLKDFQLNNKKYIK